jgi:hypothetical protein
VNGDGWTLTVEIGAIKVKCHLMFGVLALAVDHRIRVASFAPPPA